MSLLSRITAPTREVAEQLDDKDWRHIQVELQQDRNAEFVAEIKMLRGLLYGGNPATEREDRLRLDNEQLKRNLLDMEERLAAFEDRPVRHVR